MGFESRQGLTELGQVGLDCVKLGKGPSINGVLLDPAFTAFLKPNYRQYDSRVPKSREAQMKPIAAMSSPVFLENTLGQAAPMAGFILFAPLNSSGLFMRLVSSERPLS